METVNSNIKRVGICFGCFIPMHFGHLLMVTQTQNENDEIIIGVCGYDNDRGKDFVPFKDRIKLVTKRYAQEPGTTVAVIDDHKIGLTGTFSKEAWKIWSNELFQNAGYDPLDKTIEYTWYIGEQNYIDKLSELYPNHKFVKLDRHVINISGTEIRNNAAANENMILDDFKEYLRNKNII